LATLLNTIYACIYQVNKCLILNLFIFDYIHFFVRFATIVCDSFILHNLSEKKRKDKNANYNRQNIYKRKDGETTFCYGELYTRVENNITLDCTLMKDGVACDIETELLQIL
jgi:hypothetical protein